MNTHKNLRNNHKSEIVLEVNYIHTNDCLRFWSLFEIATSIIIIEFAFIEENEWAIASKKIITRSNL